MGHSAQRVCRYSGKFARSDWFCGATSLQLSKIRLFNKLIAFSFIQIVAAIICTTGVSLLAYMNAIDKRTSFYVLIGTIAAGAAATYKVFYRRIIGKCFSLTLLLFLNQTI